LKTGDPLPAEGSGIARAGVLCTLIAVGIAWGTQPAAAQQASAGHDARPLDADFAGEAASSEAKDAARWVTGSQDNRNLPFIIVDKVNAKVFVFDRLGGLKGAAAALLGLGVGDENVPGIGKRRLATITPQERITPAGRFQAALGHDLDQDVLWIDYESSLSLHRVIAGNPKDHRAQRLASPSHLDNRISYGCINVPAAFYDKVLLPAFVGRVGIVYILPELQPPGEMFAGAGRAVAPESK
jgi:hypothetical protein